MGYVQGGWYFAQQQEPLSDLDDDISMSSVLRLKEISNYRQISVYRRSIRFECHYPTTVWASADDV